MHIVWAVYSVSIAWLMLRVCSTIFCTQFARADELQFLQAMLYTTLLADGRLEEGGAYISSRFLPTVLCCCDGKVLTNADVVCWRFIAGSTVVFYTVLMIIYNHYFVRFVSVVFWFAYITSKWDMDEPFPWDRVRLEPWESISTSFFLTWSIF